MTTFFGVTSVEGHWLSSAVPVELRGLGERELSSAVVLLLETNRGKTPEELLANLHGQWLRWPSLQRVAARGERLVGLVAGRVDSGDPRLGWSDDTVVAEPYRGQGLGSLLLRGQLDAFRTLGCTRVRGLSAQSWAAALPFYERHGFHVVEREVAHGLWGVPEGEEVWVTERSLLLP